MVLLLNILVLLFLIFRVGLKTATPFKPVVFRTALVLKLAAGWLLGYFYWYIAGEGDTLHFYREALKLTGMASHSFTDYLHYLVTPHHPHYMAEARNDTFVRLLSIVLLGSSRHYWMACTWLSLVNFLACWYLVRSVATKFPEYKWPFYIGFLWIPSAVFWSSGILKDTVVNGAVFFLMGVVFKYYSSLRFRPWEWILTLLSLWVLLHIRYYLAALAFVALALLLLDELILKRNMSKAKKYFVAAAGAAAALLFVSSINRNLNFDQLPMSIYHNYSVILAQSDPGKALRFTSLQPAWSSLILHLPAALASGLFRPLPGEGTLSNLVYGIENIFLVFLFICNAVLLIKKKVSVSKVILPVWMGIGFILILASFLPLAAPNFGSLARYKAVFLPLLFSFLLLLPFQFIYHIKKHKSLTLGA